MEKYSRGDWDVNIVSDFVNSHIWSTQAADAEVQVGLDGKMFNHPERGQLWQKGGAVQGKCEGKVDVRVRMARQDSGRLGARNDCLELLDLQYMCCVSWLCKPFTPNRTQSYPGSAVSHFLLIFLLLYLFCFVCWGFFWNWKSGVTQANLEHHWSEVLQILRSGSQL